MNRKDNYLIEEYAKKLESIRDKLAFGDIEDAAIALKSSRPWISQYLNGKPKTIRTAEKLITYFENLLEERKKRVSI